MRTTRANANGCRSPNVLGYSLPEALIAALVLVIVLLAIYMVYDTGLQDYARGTARADAQQNVRVALESMARELRTAGYNPYITCAPPPPPPPGYSPPDTVGVTALTSSPASVTFWADVDGDNCLDQVTYTFVPATNPTKFCDSSDPATVGKITRSVQKWTGTAWNPTTPTAYDVAQCVTAPTILMPPCSGAPTTDPMTFCDRSGVPTTIPRDVRRITISIEGAENTRGWGARTYRLTSDVRLRNL
jgi:type II secretory pathway pseudopilin PulG